MKLLGRAEETAVEAGSGARDTGDTADLADTARQQSRLLALAVAQEEQEWWRQERQGIRERGREDREGGGRRDGVSGRGRRGDGRVVPACRGWLGWWPLKGVGVEGVGVEGVGVPSAGSACHSNTNARRYVLPDVGPLSLDAQYITPRWLDASVDHRSILRGRSSSQKGEVYEAQAQGEEVGAEVVVGGGRLVFVPLFGCLGASAVTFCLDLNVRCNLGGSCTRTNHQIVWSVHVGDGVELSLEWCGRHLRNGGVGAGAGERDGMGGLSVRFSRLSKEYQLMFAPLQDHPGDADAAGEAGAVKGGGWIRVCVSFEKSSPSILWINGKEVVRSKRRWRSDAGCAGWGGQDQRVCGEKAGNGEDESVEGCANAWWAFQDGGIAGIWLGGSPLAKTGAGDSSAKTSARDFPQGNPTTFSAAGGRGAEGGVAGDGDKGELLVANFGVYGGRVGDVESLQRMEREAEVLRGTGGARTWDEDEAGGGVVIEEPAAFALVGLFDETIEQAYLALLSEHPNCLRLLVHLQSSSHPATQDAWEGIELQVWLDERALGGVEVLTLPEPQHGVAAAVSELRREVYICKFRSGSQMQWRALRVSLVGQGAGGEAEGGLGVVLSSDTVWFAEMDRLFELGGWCRQCFVRVTRENDVGGGWRGDVEGEGQVGVTQLPSASVGEMGPRALLPILEDMYRSGSWFDCGMGMAGTGARGGGGTGMKWHSVALMGVRGAGAGEEGEEGEKGEEGRWSLWVEAGVGRYVVEEMWVGGSGEGVAWVPQEGRDRTRERRRGGEGGGGWDGWVGGVEANKCAPYSFVNVRHSHETVLGDVLQYSVSVSGDSACVCL